MRPKAREHALVIQELPTEVLVYDLENNKAHCLNQTAGTIWHYCDGNRTAAAIADEYSRSVGTVITTEFVWLALDQLAEHNLLQNRMSETRSGMSRRKAFKTLALSSLIALPVISSLVAPPNALAAASCSCTGNLTCGSYPPGQCASTNNCNTLGVCAP